MSSSPQISVIIPTYNRADILDQCLACLDRQHLSADQFEVVVVNDGSQDHTEEILEAWKQKASYSLEWQTQQNRGQGIARNLALRMAKGHLVVFIGDDILVHPDFLQVHVNAHGIYPEESVAVLGFIDWHDSLEVTPYMDWLTNGSAVFGRFGGHQFAFEKLHGKKWADYRFFYTSNLSLKRSVFDRFGFDTDFSAYGWEDIELGYRLSKEMCLRVKYEPGALGYHLHHLDESTLEPRMKKIGASAWMMFAKHPELRHIPGPLKKGIFQVLGSSPVVGFLGYFQRSSPAFRSLYFYALSKRYFLQGVREGKPGVSSFS